MLDLMHTLLKISLLLFATVLPASAAANTDALSGSNTVAAEIQPIEEGGSPSAYPASQPNLFRIHHQGESAVHVLERLPLLASSANDSQEHTYGGSLAESTALKRASMYLFFCKIIDSSLTIKKLIFPFHSFL